MTRILRARDVYERTGLSQSYVYKWMLRGKFPRPIKLGPKRVGWPEPVIEKWIANRIAESEGKLEAAE